VDQDEDFARGAEFVQGADGGGEAQGVRGGFAGGDVEDEDEDCDRGEDVGALVAEVGFYEGVLADGGGRSLVTSMRPVRMFAALLPSTVP